MVESKHRKNHLDIRLGDKSQKDCSFYIFCFKEPKTKVISTYDGLVGESDRVIISDRYNFPLYFPISILPFVYITIKYYGG